MALDFVSQHKFYLLVRAPVLDTLLQVLVINCSSSCTPRTSGRNSSNEIPNPYSIVLHTLLGTATVKKFLLFYGTHNFSVVLKFIQPTLCPEPDESVYTLQTYYFLFILIALSHPHLDLPSATFQPF